MFIGRERELADFNRRYDSGKFEFAVIYGRRRVGKTTLINEFVKDKECILYSATETNAKQNLTELSRSIYALSDDYNNSESVFASFQAAFETVFSIAENRRIVFVIDEYPYLASCSKEISSVIQLLIDRYHENSIISAIANGASRLSEICTKTDIDTSLASSYISKLIGLGIVKKELPYGADNSRKAIYALEDSMFRFWYKFVQDNISVIYRGFADMVYKKIEPQLPGFMGAVFKEICTQYLWKMLEDGESPIDFTNLGRWWGTDPRTKKQTEIDIMGVSSGNDYLFGECKWTNEKVDLTVPETLVSRSELFNCRSKHFYIFAKSGFTKGCIEKAEDMENVTLVEYSEMLEK